MKSVLSGDFISCRVWNMSDVLFTKEQIAVRVDELADAIKEDSLSEELVLIGVLTGACLFTADLARALWERGMQETILDFIALSSYGSGTESSRNPLILKDLSLDVSGKHVLIVEDILETGHSLKTLVKLLEDRGVASVKTVVLLDKPEKRDVDIQADFVGFTIDHSVWVEGYGLDTDHKGRGNPDVIAK